METSCFFYCFRPLRRILSDRLSSGFLLIPCWFLLVLFAVHRFFIDFFTNFYWFSWIPLKIPLRTNINQWKWPKSMKIPKNQWKSMKMTKNQWKLLKSVISIVIVLSDRLSGGFPLALCWFPLFLFMFHWFSIGISLNFIDFHWKFHCEPMKINGNDWKINENANFHWFPLIFIGFH